MLKTINLIFILLIADTALASCFIEEVVDLHDSGYSASEIREQCGGKVDESDCSIGKVIRYAREDKGLSYILRRCELRDNSSKESSQRNQYQLPTTNMASFCITPYGSCKMGTAIPQGSACYCPSLFGPIWGIGQ